MYSTGSVFVCTKVQFSKFQGEWIFSKCLSSIKLRNKENEWKLENIEKVTKGSDTIQKIMKEHYLQETPLFIEGYADFIKLREGIYNDTYTQLDSEYSFFFIDFNNMRKNRMKHSYQYLRTQNSNKEEGKKSSRLFIYDDYIFNKNESDTNLILDKNPFNGIFKVEKVIYGESIQPFYTLATKKNSQKFICNIGLSEDKEVNMGNLNISLVNPLYLRYMYLMNYRKYDNAKFSELDLFNIEEKNGKFPTFDYGKINHATLQPGDCLYVPANWWVQLDHMMHKKFPGSNEPMYEKYLPKDEEKDTVVKWIEYEYTNLNYLEDEAFEGLENGYGS